MDVNRGAGQNEEVKRNKVEMESDVGVDMERKITETRNRKGNTETQNTEKRNIKSGRTGTASENK